MHRAAPQEARRRKQSTGLRRAARALIVWLGAIPLPAGAAGKAPTTRPRADLNDLLARFSASGTPPAERLGAAERILELGQDAAKRLLPLLQSRERFVQAAYQRQFQLRATHLRAAKTAELAARQNKTRAQINRDIRGWRKTVLSLHGKEGLTEQVIHRQTAEAMAKLNDLLYVDRRTVLARTPELARQRAHVLKLVTLGRRCERIASGRAGPPPAAEDDDPRKTPDGSLSDYEDLACLLAMPMIAASRQIILSNVKKEPGLRWQEAAGIRDFNRIRFLLGLWALQTDLRLCACARDHCRDMRKHRFVGHDSPLPGKRKPWDRAKLFGTRAGAENITVGPTDPKRANQNWFHSPTHFFNLFHKFKYVGLGYEATYWTQMFGW